MARHFTEREFCEIVWLVATEHVYNMTNIGLNIHSDMLCDISRKKWKRHLRAAKPQLIRNSCPCGGRPFSHTSVDMTSPIKIVEFAFIVYPATDLTRSRAFYEGVLGLTSATSFQNGNHFWVEYETGPHTLGIGNEPFLKPSGDGPHLALEVENFDETIEHLRRHKVPFALEPAVMPPGCRAAIVTDPDGNKLGIHKRKV